MANNQTDGAQPNQKLRYLYDCSQSALLSTPYHRRFSHKWLLDFQALQIDRQDLGFHCQDHILPDAGFAVSIKAKSLPRCSIHYMGKATGLTRFTPHAPVNQDAGNELQFPDKIDLRWNINI